MALDILFVMTTMRTGGIASSLRNLLSEIANRPELKITLLLFDDSYLNHAQLPDSVEIISAGTLPRVIALSQEETTNISWTLGIIRLYAGFLAKFISQASAYKFLFSGVKIDRKWDVAISCSQSAPIHHLYGGCNEFVLDKVVAERKIAFIHCDYKSYGINSRYSHSIYSRFDKIATVSDSVKEVFLKEEPELRNKTATVYNCHNIGDIIRLSNDNPIIIDHTFFNLVTVARLSEEKGHFRALNAIIRLVDEGYRIKWHVVGGSNDNFKKDFIRKITKAKIFENVILYGDQKNPYRIMKNCDLLLVPSFHEAAPMVFGEAQILDLPILTTDTVSAHELVEYQDAGVVCENSEEGIYCGLKRFLDNPINMNDVSSYSNEVAVSQFLNLIGECQL